MQPRKGRSARSTVIARADPQALLPPTGEALAIFLRPDAYVSPSFDPSKREHGRVVPTWNSVAVHAYGPAEVFDEPARLRDVVARLTELHQQDRPEPWSIDDAPDELIRAQLKGIVGFGCRSHASRASGR
ncbi:MAG: FMN-binding negative transcriptional regulator [Elioraea sp.]|nr:FMN-binding negative transcriptional regulator [Elioraea sp.]